MEQQRGGSHMPQTIISGLTSVLPTAADVWQKVAVDAG